MSMESHLNGMNAEEIRLMESDLYHERSNHQITKDELGEMKSAAEQLLDAISKKHPTFAIDDPKEEKLYLAYHNLRKLVKPELYDY